MPPLHDSAARAYAYSAIATAGGIGAGYVLYRVLPEGDPTRDSYTPRDLGLLVIAVSAIGGPMVGNGTLGADRDLGRSLVVKSTGILVGGVFVLSAVAVCLSIGDPSAACESAGGPLFVAGIAVLGAGFVVGTVYDLATIPRNAARAREERRGRAVTVAPSGAGVAVRVPL